MYFNAEVQSRILGRFHFALVPRGVLFLGKAEMLLSHGHIFEPVNLKRRIFRRVQGDAAAPKATRFERTGAAPVDALDQLREGAFAASPVAQLVVTADDDLAVFNDQAAQLLGLHAGDIGRPLRGLEISYRPSDLRTRLAEVKSGREPVRITEVEWQRADGVVHWFEVQVNPLAAGDVLLGVSFVFDDVTVARTLRRELERANRQLEATNEELQSTNDELQIVNDTLRDRGIELNRVNDFLESILTGINAGVIVVDQEMRILAWNAGAQELWGVRADEVQGQHLLNLDVGLPMTELRPIVRDASPPHRP